MSNVTRFGKRREKVFGLRWTSHPSRIDYTEKIEAMAKSLNKQYKRDRVNQVRRAQVQNLQYGMSQLVLWTAEII